MSVVLALRRLQVTLSLTDIEKSTDAALKVSSRLVAVTMYSIGSGDSADGVRGVWRFPSPDISIPAGSG
eukprot:CAMPEP_0204294944 /NCGR_PEP_ID=MMETSP0468-20130131/68861_1 /ASSEMBLY_ACC=CAM_ASM_000383 /TAXON_ID=2969 /ORGANISM="Oxyrrhis marina" /LENGTH=68 /DNA_ID=CAMNT_0051273539 /DNA_START=69 /DNA_END=271 /DNA_ORIENTATION=-